MFEIGDKVWYRGRWGGDPPIAATITGHGEKNGKAILDCQADEGQEGDRTSWGYLFQFEPHPRACGESTIAEDAAYLAAAPDLLEACKMALAWIENAMEAFGENAIVDSLPNNCGGRIQLREAIAKATREM